MSVKFTILGCGSSLGVPRADGYWGECNPKEKKNYRTRCSAILQTRTYNILIDTSPDLRSISFTGVRVFIPTLLVPDIPR